MPDKNFRVRHGLEVGGNEIAGNGGTPAITLSGADVTIAGNLTVNGGTTTIESTTLVVDDPNIVLGKDNTTNAQANGGGITVKGATDKTITYDNSVARWTTNIGLEVGGRLSTDATYGLTVSENQFETGTVSAFVVGGATGDASLYGDMYLAGGSAGQSDLVMNSRTTGNASQNATISVERGDDPNARIRWNESTDKWQQTRNNVNYYDIAISTDELAEGSTNKYFSNTLARSSLSAGTGISYDSATGVITNTVADTNTTYTQNASSVSGGANLNLVGSDSSTDAVKFNSGTGVTVTRTDADTIDIAIGQAVGTNSNVQFNDIALTGNISDTGALQISTGANGNITLAPNGTGVVVGNNSIFNGPLRSGTGTTTLTAPNIFNFAGGNNYRGMLISNAVSGGYAAARTGLVMRSVPTTAIGPRGGVIFENARTDASGVLAAIQGPSTTQAGDFLGEIIGGGYCTDRYASDAIASVPMAFTPYATETWSNTAGTNTNVRCGSGWALQLQPTGVNLSATSRITTIDTTPQNLSIRSDSQGFSRGKTIQFSSTGSSISGTTLTIGTVIAGTVAVGSMIQNSTNLIPAGTYITANISGSGAGSTWTLNQAPGDNTGLTVVGYRGFVSMTAAGNVDVIPQLTTRGPVRFAVTAAGNFAGGSTYTPAATVSNAMSATINSGTGGFTVALTNLIADSTTGGHYQIFVLNSTGSNQTVTTTGGVVNINHNLGAGAGMMITIYVVGGGAFCEHIA